MSTAAARALALAAAACLNAAVPAAAADRSSIPALVKPTAGGVPWTPAATAALRTDLDTLLAGPELRTAHVGVLVLDTATGASLYEAHAGEAFQPASTLKLLVGSAALARLGPAYRFTTTLTWQPPVLTVHAGGDALLTAADLDDAARAAARAGVRAAARVDVDVARYDSQPYLPGWTWDDFPYAYAAPVSAAALEENALHAIVAPGARAGDPAAVRVAPAESGISVRNTARTGPAGTDDTLDVARAGDAVLLTGAIPLGAAAEDVAPAVPDPRAYMRAVLSAALRRAGVRLDPAAAVRGPAATTIWTHAGEPLAEELADFWYPSDNLIGELLLKELAAANGTRPATAAAGIALETDWLRTAGIDPAGAALSDGSGLSTYDRVPPRLLAAILQADWSGPARDIVLDALPVAGVRGTLANSYAGTAAAGRVFAKTGSFSHVATLAGYLRPVCRGAVTFVFMADDYVGPARALSDARGRVLSRVIDDPC